MTKHLYIMTGASRGMGLCLAQQLLKPQHQLVCISRTVSDVLSDSATRLGAKLIQWSADLSAPQHTVARLGQWLAEQSPQQYCSVTLINNAGVIPPIAPLNASNPLELAQALRVGLEAPLVLTASFLASTRHWAAIRKVLNISSGLGRRPMASQAAYCAAKAGMDHFTRCLALDEALSPNGARVCSLAPGVIDTDMQLQLRSAAPENFPDQVAFNQLYETQQLTTPQVAAQRVIDFLNRADFGSQSVADVRA
jgi:NAD(P)-dependent dehydrogenase (short-subunit alcohol dehydrogenase family)